MSSSQAGRCGRATAVAAAVGMTAMLAATPAGAAEPASWQKDVFPVLQKFCLGCHSDLVQKGGLNLEQRDSILKGGAKKGPSVLAGKPESSPLVTLLDGKTEPVMPPKGKRVPPDQIALIARWVKEGAKFDGAGTLELAKPSWIPLAEAVSPVYAVALSADGDRLAIGRGNKVEVWDVEPAKRLAVITGANDLIQSLAFAPDGKTLAIGEFETVHLVGTADWKPVAKLEGHLDRVTAMDFSKDGKTLVTASGLPVKNGVVHVWDLEKRKELRRFEAHTDCIYGLELSPDEKWVATASGDKLAKIHVLADGKFVRTFAGHTNQVLGVAFTPDQKNLITAGADSDVKLWDIEKGEKTKDGKGHKNQVSAVLSRPDAKAFYTAGGDKTVREWSMSGNPARTVGTMGDYAYCLTVSADGTRLASGGQDGTVFVVATATGKPYRTFDRTTPPEPAAGTKLDPGPAKAAIPQIAIYVPPPPKPAMTPATTVTPPAAGDLVATPLVKAGSEWRHSAESAAGKDWTKDKFDDAKWAKVKAPVGYGEEEITTRKGTVTTLTGQNVAFRHEFTVDAKALEGVKGFKLLVASDDSAAVYINGELVDNDEGDHEFLYWNRMIDLPVKALRPGKNVIAVQVRNGEGSSDMYFDLQLDSLAPKKK